MRYQPPGLEVVQEGDGFHVLLDAGRDLRLVAPGVEVVQVGGDGGEEVGDLGLVGGDFFGDGGGDGRVEVADSRRMGCEGLGCCGGDLYLGKLGGGKGWDGMYR